MLPSPVIVMTPPEGTGAAGRWRGRPAVRPAMAGGLAAAQPVAGPEVLAVDGCCAWPLPLDATCAREARRVFRAAAAGLGITGDELYDGITMVSEIAANTLHAHDNVELDGASGCPLAGAPELWLYLRRTAGGSVPGGWELVCKVFDSVSGWGHGPGPVPDMAAEASVSGRGLQVVAALSGGRWGHHPTRSRLGGWKVPGKAVWFTQPVTAASVPAWLRRASLAPRQAAWALETMLADRGLGEHLLRAEEPSARLSVLSVRPGLTVWCRDRVIWWQAADGRYQRRVPTDLTDVAEEIVRTCEEMRTGG